MPVFRLVPPVEPSAGQAAILRLKRMTPDWVLQCNRCGSRTSMTLVNGAEVRNGRIQGGTVILRHVCAECYKRGVTQFMLPDPPRLVKPPKPRRRKLKLVK
ncbi:MAG: hypothetical protein LBI48_11415 [Burkholderiaceae bacterium]|jgi:hypothetical protein|nr:hypothetical protein [Burkholderiaceae bacterium]